jgi:hypothetical protein
MMEGPLKFDASGLFEGLSREPLNTIIILTFIVFLSALLGWHRGEMESKREYQKFVKHMEELQNMLDKEKR